MNEMGLRRSSSWSGQGTEDRGQWIVSVTISISYNVDCIYSGEWKVERG